jgi:hypothetical protein
LNSGAETQSLLRRNGTAAASKKFAV